MWLLQTLVCDKIAKHWIDHLAKQQEPIKRKEKAVRDNRTCLVRKPQGKSIRSSRDIRKEFNKHFPSMLIRECRTTAAGSILLELDDVEAAKEVETNWNSTFFRGNSGVNRANKHHSCGIVKHVDDAFTEGEITSAITKTYKDAAIELFKKGVVKKFTGTIKITFKDKNQLEQAIKNKVRIDQQ